MSGRYVVISPARNEAAFIGKTMDSVLSQTVRPTEWVIVNDGSTDGTRDIVLTRAADHPWIRLVDRVDRGFDNVGNGVIQVFNRGLSALATTDWEYIVKLDCDLSFPPDFFETVLQEFERTDRLGICGGTTFTVTATGELKEEKVPLFHPIAAARTYSRACFSDIKGLPEVLGWDTIDLLRAQMKGWLTRRLPHLRITHHRLMASRNGTWEGKLRTGRNFYITGYHPIFLLARSLYRVKERPYLVETVGVIAGYIRAMLRGEKLVVTPEERAFFRSQQLKRLFSMSAKH